MGSGDALWGLEMPHGVRGSPTVPGDALHHPGDAPGEEMMQVELAWLKGDVGRRGARVPACRGAAPPPAGWLGPHLPAPIWG